MSYSLNEIEATAYKATRAVGYPWGIAVEAAKSVRWLCRHDIDGCAVLCRFLEYVDGKNIATLAPVIDGYQWHPENTSLCPLLTGAAISDRARTLNHHGFSLQQIVEPALLLYFTASVAKQCQPQAANSIVSVAWSGCCCTTDGGQMNVVGAVSKYAEDLMITFSAELVSPQALCNRARPDVLAWQSLNSFAARTYAPATEESRLLGAGAGLSDND